ncbi:hypothetical protein EVAR_94641_1 [Eumeta japonica]|uniref:Uncharacterized protein n=1 Tax=Eumeta variegata TaxID=151549 RepID=A0A4C1UTK6_EUMVA|nr:hypothetical protein EVAR_94641_1 [Eumeta japonica]
MKLVDSALEPSRSRRYHVNSSEQQGPVERQLCVVEPQGTQTGFAFIICGSETKHGSAPNHATGHRKRRTKRETPCHSVVHHIEATGPPVFAKARPLQPDRYRRLKEEFHTMMNLQTIEESMGQPTSCRPEKRRADPPMRRLPTSQRSYET